ncbi:polysaccharide biosynthesis C-terminal domain-containing protein [Roseospira navarrensis]|uniref:Oligosaccharide flippase family protein n=1 Tax=Roseospira navarrensis TaxID=140058 RepID=A0A7X2D5Y0_9PROT|nr:polysaccharide biosynthesis C-terminal domain-containing protein [Roseospira navarrensis]MQX37720.1 oligosaccharide flippase family protein [Roseospira navarrensis]
MSRIPRMPATARRFLAYGLDSGLPALLSLLLLTLAARSTDMATFGTFALALAIAGLQTPLAAFGLITLFFGRAASRPAGAVLIFWPGVVATLVAGAVLYGGTLTALWALAPPLLTTLYALVGLRVLGAVAGPIKAIHQARSRPDRYVPWRLVTIAAAFAATGAVVALDGGLAGYALVWGLEWLVFAAGLLAGALRSGALRPVARPRVRPVLTKAGPLFVQAVCIAVYLRFDQVYVAWRFGEAELGLYAAAARIAEAGTMVYGVVGLVVAPRIIREWTHGRLSGPARGALAGIALGAVAASGLCWVWGGDLLRLLFGPPFAAGGTILAIYVLSTCFTVYGAIGSRINVAQGTTLPSMIAGLVGAVSNVALSILLCEIQGPAGAATATVASYALSCTVTWGSALARSRRGPRAGR